MRKFLPAALAVMCVMAISCKKSPTETEHHGQSLKSRIESCTDADSLAKYVKEAAIHADKLVKAGKVDEARKYVDDLTPAIAKQSPAHMEEWSRAIKAAGNISKATADSIGGKTVAAADTVIDKAAEAAETVGKGAKNAVDKVKEKSTEVYDKAKNGAKDGADDVKSATEEVVDRLKKK